MRVTTGFFSGLFAAAISALPLPTMARDWPETAGWEIAEGDDVCLMSMEYEGPGDSSLVTGLHSDGEILVADVNYDSSAEQGRS